MTVNQVKRRFGIIGENRGINNAVEIALQVAPTDVTVLVYGENGTGKDVFSRIIHTNSKRKHEPFIAINCGAIPEGTLDSELFGHEKGAFTSAYEQRKGYFEEVENGTIFLDEIAEMPMATQARLLRFLESGEYLRVGSSKVRKADVRVIAATNKNLVELIRQNKFREDLYFRLNTVTIFTPPLRERGEDIALLFAYFAMEFSDKYRRDPVELTVDALPLLSQYRWPGNVRELRNLVEKLTVLVEDGRITPEVLRQNLLIQERYLPSVLPDEMRREIPRHDSESRRELDAIYDIVFDLRRELSELKRLMYENVRPQSPGVAAPTPERPFSPRRQPAFYPGSFDNEDNIPAYAEILAPAEEVPMIEESLSLEKKERELIEKALTKYNNNRKKAAEALGISERTLYRKIKNYDLN